MSMSRIRNRFGAAIALAAAAAVTLGAAGEAAAATTMRCNIGRWGFSPCTSDNVTVPPGKKVYIELNSSGQKDVKFQVRNMFVRKLAEGREWQDQDEDAYFLWTNNMGKPVRIDIYADAKGITNVTAIADIIVR